jgi:hypothetical protein
MPAMEFECFLNDFAVPVGSRTFYPDWDTFFGSRRAAGNSRFLLWLRGSREFREPIGNRHVPKGVPEFPPPLRGGTGTWTRNLGWELGREGCGWTKA